MNRRSFLFSVGMTAVALSGCRSVSAHRTKRPLNFLFILVDDLGWKDLGCFGSGFYETPNIDRLCESGMKFTDAYAACPVCSPTRSSIMSGKYPARTNNTDYFGSAQPERWRRNTKLLPAQYIDRLPHGEVTIAEALKGNGYSTFFAGKWHLGPEGFWPQDQGFDYNEGGNRGGGPYGGKKYFSPYGNPTLEDGPEGEHLPDRLASETTAFIKDARDKPFLAYLSFYSVHTPLMARKDLRDKYERKREAMQEARWGQERGRKVRLDQDHAVYAGMLEAMDEAVGKVLEALDLLGLAENTAVFFMSDNGGLSTSEGSPTSNLPLRGGKGWLYEGGIREPMIVRWPGVTEEGGVCSFPVTSTDFYPTMLEMTGLPLMPKQHADGVSLVPLLRGESSIGRSAIFWHYPHYGNQGSSPGGAVRSGDWKLIEWYEDGKLELFNLAKDIGESVDLAESQPQRVKEMHRQLIKWREGVAARMPTENVRFDPKRRVWK